MCPFTRCSEVSRQTPSIKWWSSNYVVILNSDLSQKQRPFLHIPHPASSSPLSSYGWDSRQMTKSISTIAHFIPRGMLVLALGRWPYGYHMLLRVVVFASGLLIATLIYQRMKDFTAWVVVFLIAAIIFNPILPLHLT